MYKLQINKKSILLSLLFFSPLHSMQKSNVEVCKRFIVSKKSISAINLYLNNNAKDDKGGWKTIKKNKRSKNNHSSNQVPKKLVNLLVKKRYPKIFEAYEKFSMKDLDHVIERHYDPYGKKMHQSDCQKLLHKPYQGYVNNKYTTFFPQACKTATIYNCIDNVLANPYRVTPSTYNNQNAFVVKGKFINGVTTAVVIVQRPEWKVITAYPKFQKSIKY